VAGRSASATADPPDRSSRHRGSDRYPSTAASQLGRIRARAARDPFVHPAMMKKEMSPTGNPKSYRQEFLKTIVFLLNVMPLVDLGFIFASR